MDRDAEKRRMPEACRLNCQGVLEPEAFKAVAKAFEASWMSISCLFVGQPKSIVEDARTVLAVALINAANAGLAEGDALKEKGLRAVKIAYPYVPI